jgi:sulfide:quinone oxidoreductase
VTASTPGNKLDAGRRRPLAYDYLVITTGPKLSFDEVPGAGPHRRPHALGVHRRPREKFWADYQEFLKNPGPVVIGAMPMASCFGPAYEFAFILDADLRKRKLRHKVPMTFVTSEPYIGHLGLGGVGDSKSMLESELRGHDIKWITNAKTTKVEAGKMFVTELDDLGQVFKEHEVPVQAGHDAARLQGRGRGGRGAQAVQPARLRADRRAPAQQGLQEHLLGRRVRGHPAGGGHARAHRRAQDRLHDRDHGDGHRAQHRRRAGGPPARHQGTWNAICLADMGDTGAAFVALPQIPPRNVNWFKKGKWVHLAKIAFEKYFMRKMKTGNSEPGLREVRAQGAGHRAPAGAA